ncbi:MAG TPA: OmpA family protein, partial [Azospirillaceae bacterium]|nr:OmpA family protein [Azospirillaceae bacterium]
PPPAAVMTPPPIQAAPPPSQPVKPTAPPQPAPPAVVAERKADFLILFDFASAKIAKQSEPLLTRIAAAMNAPAAAEMRFDIVGHTDGVGAAAANLALSQRRAAAIKVWLAKEGGVDARRLNAYGKGKEQLADPAQPAAAVNRRVEIISRPASP